ncbi:transcriptional regulator [Clostridium sp.]|uniref:LexA family protein n=1 Tax=Clostridium sp. TaxID=1506 RepID=UPI001A573AD8|nr:transcriptional regulator [Clostridium sp.]MBK5240557.1 transcriptional regulator [Clostridium sp.]
MLNEKEKRILEAIVKFQTDRGYTPTIRELHELINGSNSISTIHIYLKKLEEDGYIKREKRVARTIKIIKHREE